MKTQTSSVACADLLPGRSWEAVKLGRNDPIMPKTMEYIEWWEEHDREIAQEIRRGDWE